MMETLGETQSLCPVCLGVIAAQRVAIDGDVYLQKSCPQHGDFSTLIWRGAEMYKQWGRFGVEMGSPARSQTESACGCPYDCGLCPRHLAATCVAIMEVTGSCNLDCPLCFASAGGSQPRDPDMETIRGMYRTVLESAGAGCPLQLSGGEPTTRDDLPRIVSLGQEMGFGHIQVNTNGLRIAEDIAYLHRLKQAGASAVYLQFDGVSDDVYMHTRGRGLVDVKRRAVENCAEVKIGVILVPTLVGGVNMHQVGDIYRFARSWMPYVKGIHFQPASFFGRYPAVPRDEERVTIPDVLAALQQQSGGQISVSSFAPRRRKESHCAFGGSFVLTEEDEMLPLTTFRGADADANRAEVAPYRRAHSFISRRWRFVEDEAGSGQARPGSWQSLFSRAKTHCLAISGMPFQDVWSIDLERVRRCCTHVVTADRRLVPLCAHYVTATDGRRLHRHAGSEDVPRALAA